MDCRHATQRVIGFGHTQNLVTNTIFFRRNCQSIVAEAVKEIRKTVIGDCKVLYDKVIVTGKLRKEVAVREFAPCNGNLSPIADVAAEVAFSTAISVRGARPGDRCVVVQAFVEGEEEQPVNVTPQGGFTGIVDISVLFLCVMVLREITITIGDSGRTDASGETASSARPPMSAVSHTGDSSDTSDGSDTSDSSDTSDTSDGSDTCDSSDTSGETDRNGGFRPGGCPRRRSTGIYPGLGGRIPDAQPGTAPGSFVGPTGIFPGVSAGMRF